MSGILLLLIGMVMFQGAAIGVQVGLQADRREAEADEADAVEFAEWLAVVRPIFKDDTVEVAA